MSRGRKSKRKKSNLWPAKPRLEIPDTALDVGDECDCLLCSGEGIDLPQLIDQLLADMAESEDPLAAEMSAAYFVAIGELAGQEFDEMLIGGFIPQFEARASTEALTMLLALGAVAEGHVAKAASAAAGRLAAAGVARPRWADELDEPVTVGDAWRLVDPQVTASVIFCSFDRAGRSHFAIITVDHRNCAAADDVLLLNMAELPPVMEAIKANAQDAEIVRETLEPAELRWHVEGALDARAVHDDAPPWLTNPAARQASTDDIPDYRAMSVLLRARMRALPTPDKPKAPHDSADLPQPTALDILEKFAGKGADLFNALAATGPRGRAAPASLPVKRKKADGPAPVYQLKVGLRNAKPPIWRRIEVPSDIDLAMLHEIIQIAFGWHGDHLHAFETPYGDFGTGDIEFASPEESVTLAQVAPGVRSKIRYTYDFGDDWEHDILVEKILDRNPAATYPRCTGGRRAAPPDDCGGIWGYAELQEVLADPSHPEHQDRLEWLGLDDAADFDPDEFDAADVTQALSGLS